MSYPNASYLDQNLFNNGTRKYINSASINYAIPFSYPASVEFFFYYRGVVKLPNSTFNYEVFVSKECTGVLINRRSVLTAASCVASLQPSYSFSPSGYNNDTVNINKDSIPYFQDWNSHYEIYFRIYSYIPINYLKNIYPTEQLPVKEVIVVCTFYFYL